MRLSLCEAPTLKEQHKGQPQHRETSRPYRHEALKKHSVYCFVEREKMDDIFMELNLETPAAVFRREIIVNFVKKTKRTAASHRLALVVLEAPQQTEPAMYLKLTLYGRNECVFSILGVLGRSLKV